MATRARFGISARLTIGLLAAVLGLLACQRKARSLLQIDVTTEGALPGLLDRITIVINGTEESNRAFEWSKTGPLRLGFYLPSEVDGSIVVAAKGYAGAKAIAASASTTVTISPGATSAPLALHLLPLPGGEQSDAGMDGAGPDPDAGDAAGSETDPGVDGGAGEMPEQPIERVWRAAENVQKDDLSGIANTPDIAIDPSLGDVLVVWRGTGTISVRRYDAKAGSWGMRQQLASQGDPRGPRVAFGPNGQAVIMWYQYDRDGSAPAHGLWESHSSDGGKSWSTAVRVHTDWAEELAIAFAPSGDGRVAWEVKTPDPINGGTATALWSASFKAPSYALVGPAQVRPPFANDTQALYPQIVTDGSGNGIIAWSQQDAAGTSSVWGASFSSSQLAPPQLLDTSADPAVQHGVVMAPEGGAGIVMWTESVGSAQWLVFNELAGGSWKGPNRERQGSFMWPTLTLDWTGVVTVVWAQQVNGQFYNVASAQRLPGGPPTWTTGAPIENSNKAQAYADAPMPWIGVDDAGAVHAVWRRKESASGWGVFANRFAQGKWGQEVLLARKEISIAEDLVVAVAPEGRASAAFLFRGNREPESGQVFVGLFR